VVVGALVAGLSAVATASAHVVATPGFIPSGSSESVSFTGPNEREAPMTAFALTAPEGLRIEHAHAVEGWEESIDGSTATWTGGTLAPNIEATFGATLEAEAEPGVLELTAEQRYADGGVVTWPVAITITPAEESPSQNLALAGVVGLLGVLLVVALAMLARRRRTT
jgi:uncharacterized protein YcnI